MPGHYKKTGTTKRKHTTKRGGRCAGASSMVRKGKGGGAILGKYCKRTKR